MILTLIRQEERYASTNVQYVLYLAIDDAVAVSVGNGTHFIFEHAVSFLKRIWYNVL